jgi:pyruvate/2-oxoglutarate dehydrogenase complex dihydrolipoamide dehydrogenase (E3) component
LELAQAFARLGSRVTVLEPGKALADFDPELARVVLERLAAEGITVHQGISIDQIESGLERIRVHVSAEGERHLVEGSHLLLAAGRRPAISDLGLEAAGIRHDDKGIKVSAGLKTSNRRVFAIGDVTGAPPFAHVARHHADIVLQRALFRRPAKVNAKLIPWVALTDPELAQVGLNEAEAAKSAGRINVLRWPFHLNDRAQAEREASGHVKVVTARNGRILGACIAGTAASELIQMWTLAIAQNLNIKAMVDWIPPYPTFGEINKRAAQSYYAREPSSPRVRKIIGFLAKFG